VSHSEMTDAGRNESGVDNEGLPQMDEGQASDEEVAIQAPAAVCEPTGDDDVDDALGQLDAVTDEPLDSQIQVGEQVHLVLQGRLADLGKE